MSNLDTKPKAECAKSASTAELAVTAEELHIICDTTVRLTAIRQNGCSHLCVENFAPEMMRKLLLELQMHKQGMVRAEDIFGAGCAKQIDG